MTAHLLIRPLAIPTLATLPVCAAWRSVWVLRRARLSRWAPQFSQ